MDGVNHVIEVDLIARIINRALYDKHEIILLLLAPKSTLFLLCIKLHELLASFFILPRAGTPFFSLLHFILVNTTFKRRLATAEGSSRYIYVFIENAYVCIENVYCVYWK